MRIFIAGGGGYVGSALVPRLLNRGYDVTVADLLWFGRHLPAEVPVLQKDVLHLTPGELEGHDQVVFLAGLSNDPMADFSPALNFVANASGPAYLAYISKLAGVRRFVYACSCSVYGYAAERLYDESSPTVSNYPYGISKLQGEQAVTGLADRDFSVLALRKGTISGWAPRMRFDLVVNAMFKSALTEGRIRVNNPSIWRPILSMRDAVTAYVRALECGDEISGVFNIASGNFTIGEIGDSVWSALREYSDRDIDLQILSMPDLRNYKVDITRAEEVLGFRPVDGIEEIIRELVEHRSEFGDFSDPGYYNIETFKSLAIAAGLP